MSQSPNTTKKLPMWRLFWALLFIAVAVLLLLDAVGVTGALLPDGLSIWKLLLGAVLLWFFILGCRSAEPFLICPALALEVALFDEFVLRAIDSPKESLASVWLLLLVSLLLAIGLKMLQHIFRQRRSAGATKGFRGWTGVSGKLSGATTRYFDCSAPFSGHVENNMGATLVYFTNPALYRGGSSLHVENNMGSLVIHVPENWLVTANVENNLGAVHVEPSANADPALTLRLYGENNLGSTEIKYVAAEAPAADTAAQAPQQDVPPPPVLDPDEVLPGE